MKILFRRAGKIQELEEGYADEAELQRFLSENADLIPVSEIAEGARPLLCIGKEIRRGKAAAEGEGWLDLLYVDDSPQLTIVEAKLGKNRESHREVVGQILEYAAYASSWTRADIESRGNSFFGPVGTNLQEALSGFLERTDSSFNYEDFISNLENSLQNGRIRLIVAIDKPPTSLLKIAEFVNSYSEHFDLYVFQLRHFAEIESSQDIFVPTIYGRVARAEAKRRAPHIDWSWPLVQEKLGYSEDQVNAARSASERFLRILADWQPVEKLTAFGSTPGSVAYSSVECLGEDAIGVQISKRNGVEFWFTLSTNPLALPEGARGRQLRKYLYVSPVSAIDDSTLRKYAEATMRALDVEVP